MGWVGSGGEVDHGELSGDAQHCEVSNEFWSVWRWSRPESFFSRHHRFGHFSFRGRAKSKKQFINIRNGAPTIIRYTKEVQLREHMHWQRRRAAARGDERRQGAAAVRATAARATAAPSLFPSKPYTSLSASFHGKRANPEIPRGDSPVTNEETLLRNRYL